MTPVLADFDDSGRGGRRMWERLSMDVKRAALDTLVTVTILPCGSGKAFDAGSIRITWKD
ncbi:MAG: hypothetical protein IIZ12_06360 [Eggerthellaceae bacterium]|nr:hypothetical protein [Eggerthellaceae bacterium]